MTWVWNYYFVVLGLIGLLLRIYVLEFRFKEMFSPRHRYLSRFLAYFYFIALILNFQINSINILLFTCFFLELYICIDHDTKFVINYIKKEPLNNGEDRHPWVMFERLTMHIPIVLTDIIWLFNSLDPFYSGSREVIPFWEIFLGLVIGLGTFLILDRRNPFRKEKWEEPNGKNILGFILGSWILVLIILYADLTRLN